MPKENKEFQIKFRKRIKFKSKLLLNHALVIKFLWYHNKIENLEKQSQIISFFSKTWKRIMVNLC